MSDDDKHIKPEVEKEAQIPAQNASSGALSAADESQASSQKTAYPKPEVKALELWDQSKVAWNETPQGRARIRLLSRGILGAAAFAWGGWYASKSQGLKGYEFHPDQHENTPYWKFVQENAKLPLNIIARTVDELVGRPLKMAATAVTKSPEIGEDFVRFRPMTLKYSGRYNKTGGRSLGEETVGITFDFFCASIGDAFGRDLVDMFDKNAKKDWVDDKGHVDPGKAVQSAGKALFRYLTYNGGEDWAVAIPYAYFMKTQRHLLNKFVSPGFKFDANESLNGSSFKVNRQGEIIGNYNAVGAYDLQSRFTVYNIGTLMYREAYDWVHQALKGTPVHIYGDPTAKREHQSVADNVGDVVKWAARSAVKGFLTMTPAVPFFWITRTPQIKYRATFINPEDQSMLAYSLGNEHDPSLPQYGLVKGHLHTRHLEGESNFTEHTLVGPRKFLGKITPSAPNGWEAMGSPSVALNPLKHGVDLYRVRPGDGIVSRIMNPFGRANDAVRRSVRRSVRESVPGLHPRNVSRFVNASISYTPYMFTKAETARLFDTGKMDLATERMIDGAAALNFHEFKEGLGEVWHAAMQESLKDPLREAEAQRRIKLDTSAADSDNTSAAEELEQQREEEERRRAAASKISDGVMMNLVTQTPAERPIDFADHHQAPVEFSDKAETKMGAVTPAKEFAAQTKTSYHDQLSWQDRLVQGRKPSEKQNVYEDAKGRPSPSHTEKQKMQEILAAAVPPTSSKH